MEPKAKTIQERFGFSDPDLRTPKHDAIMMWLDGEVDRIAGKRPEHQEWVFDIYFDNQRYSTPESDLATAKVMLDGMKTGIIESLGESATPPIKVLKVWEKPIMDRTFTIGFADMFACCEMAYINCKFHSSYGPDGITFLESRVRFVNSWEAYFEVKPSIPSVGELIRQLRMYQTYTKGAKWFVASPDDRFESILSAQGFGFIKVPALA